MLRIYIKRLLCSVILIIFITPTLGNPTNNKAAQEQILEAFNELATRTVTNNNSEELVKFFSKEYNEYWLGWLLNNHGIDEVKDNLVVIGNILRFSYSINNIYSCSIKRNDKNVWYLSLINDHEEGTKKFQTEIEYKYSDGKWLIFGINRDYTKPVKDYSSTVIRNHGSKLKIETCDIS